MSQGEQNAPSLSETFFFENCSYTRVKHVVTPLQAAFQDGRYIGENIQLVQDLMAYLKAEDKQGLLVFCDQDNAYPRVRWDFLQQVMAKMQIHKDYHRDISARKR